MNFKARRATLGQIRVATNDVNAVALLDLKAYSRLIEEQNAQTSFEWTHILWQACSKQEIRTQHLHEKLHA